MLVKTRAVVLRVVKYGERRLIVDMFTSDTGRMAFIVTSSSGKTGIGRQLFQPLQLLDVEADIRPTAKLHKLRSARLLAPLSSIHTEAVKMSLAFFLAETLSHALRAAQGDEALFDYIADSLRWLDLAQEGYANYHLVFLLRLTRLLGFYPNVEDYDDYLKPHEAQLLTKIISMDYPTMHLYHFTRSERAELTDLVMSYYRIHIPAFPELKSLDILHALFA